MIARWDPPWIAKRALATPSAEALAWAGGTLRYDELAERARAAARALRSLGVRQRDVVGLLLPSRLAFVVLVHALQLCGAVLLPLNLRQRSAELAPQLRRAEARFLVYEPSDLQDDEAKGGGDDCAGELLAGSAGLCGVALRSDESARVLLSPGAIGGAAPACADPLCERLAPGHPLALLYTSGTTGPPKAAVLSAASFWHGAHASAERLGCEARDRWLACMPLFHVGGLAIVFRSVLAGTSVLVHSSFDARAVAREFDEDRVSLVSFVATMLSRVLEARAGRPSPPRLRAVLLGGGPAPAALLERAQELGYPIAPSYGLTEACSQVATRVPAETRPPLDGRLRPLAGVELRIVDDRGRELPVGGEGEVLVRSPTLMSGYWRDPEETRRVLRGGWLHTGDVGTLDGEGGLRVLDRRSDLIVSGGENIYPAEVEAALLEHPDVSEAGVVGLPDAEFGARPVACVVAVDGAELDAESLRAFCRERLASCKVPVHFRWSRALPRTAVGKLRRAALRAEVQARGWPGTYG